MKATLISIASMVAVALAFLEIGRHAGGLSFALEAVVIFAAMGLFSALFVPRWPKEQLLRTALKQRLRPGHIIKVELEGK